MSFILAAKPTTLTLTLPKDFSSFNLISDPIKNYDESKYIDLTLKGAETIPEEAFKSCYALGNVTLGEGVKKIDKNAFNDARYMTSLIIGDDVTDIGNHAFLGCYELVDVTFGKDVTKLSGNLFYYCPSLTKINFLSPITEVASNTFYDENAYVPFIIFLLIYFDIWIKRYMQLSIL